MKLETRYCKKGVIIRHGVSADAQFLFTFTDQLVSHAPGIPISEYTLKADSNINPKP